MGAEVCVPCFLLGASFKEELSISLPFGLDSCFLHVFPGRRKEGEREREGEGLEWEREGVGKSERERESRDLEVVRGLSEAVALSSHTGNSRQNLNFEQLLALIFH